jgi:hypothetical protein
VVLRAADLPALVESLKKAGLPFRNEMEVGPAGKQSWKTPTGIRSSCSSRRDSTMLSCRA